MVNWNPQDKLEPTFVFYRLQASNFDDAGHLQDELALVPIIQLTTHLAQEQKLKGEAGGIRDVELSHTDEMSQQIQDHVCKLHRLSKCNNMAAANLHLPNHMQDVSCDPQQPGTMQ